MKVEVRVYDVIYEAVNDLKLAMEGLLKPEEVEHVRGTAEVRQLFKIPKAGMVAGSYAASGVLRARSLVHVLRDGETIHSGRLSSLRRFKDEVKEVEAGLECGIAIENYNDVKEGDIIQFYETEQILRKIG